MNSQHKAVWKGQEVMSDKSQAEQELGFTSVELPGVCVFMVQVLSVPNCYNLSALELFLKCC